MFEGNSFPDALIAPFTSALSNSTKPIIKNTIRDSKAARNDPVYCNVKPNKNGPIKLVPLSLISYKLKYSASFPGGITCEYSDLLKA
jgi:hypothetical protein